MLLDWLGMIAFWRALIITAVLVLRWRSGAKAAGSTRIGVPNGASRA